MADTADAERHAEEVPFDLFGDLEDAYDDADLNGDVEVMETLDAFGLWKERQKCGISFLLTIRRALDGDAEAQADVGQAFFWTSDDPEEERKRLKWMDRPDLSAYWCELAANAGCARAQDDLACLYCPDMEPHGGLEVGPLAREWLEKGAAQRHRPSMHDLAYCLRCGKCACCSRDIPRAEALEAEASALSGGVRAEFAV